jgi:hypothetical protein
MVAERMAAYKAKQQRKPKRKPPAPAGLQGGVAAIPTHRPACSLRDLRDMFYLETPLSSEQDEADAA